MTGVLEAEMSNEVRINFPRSNYPIDRIRWHHELTPAERSLINDSSECPLFEIIDGMTRLEQEKICNLFGYKNIGHYNQTQITWYLKERELLEWNRGKKPTEEELYKDIVEKGTPLRYKLWYLAMFPEKVIIKGGLDHPSSANNEDLNAAEEFLYDANLVKPFCKNL